MKVHNPNNLPTKPIADLLSTQGIKRLWYTVTMRNKKSPQTYRINGSITEIDLRDKEDKVVAIATIDTSDFNEVKEYKWCLSSGYAYGYSKGKFIMMHRLLTKAPSKKQVDHINHDRLDNRRSNLRVCTQAENCRNHGYKSNNKYIGVRKQNEKTGYWAHISHNNKFIHIGTYKTAEEAARARDKVAIKLHGKYAVVNFA